VTAPKPRNYDGGIWRLAWKQSPEGEFHAWVVNVPAVRASGRVWNAVQEELYHRISDELQGGEWTADWDPSAPLPTGNNYRTDPDFVVLAPDGRYYLFGDICSLFDHGVCRRCGSACGQRTNQPLRVFVEISGGIMFCGSPGAVAPPGPNLFTRSILEELGDCRLAGAQVRPVARLDRSRTEVLELVVSPALYYVAIAGLALQGWNCPDCGRNSFVMRPARSDYLSGAVQADLIPRRVESFWLGTYETRLCVRREWWSSVRTKPACRGVIAEPLIIADHTDVIGTRSLPERPADGDIVKKLMRRQAHLAGLLGLTLASTPES
jgi:hypothetical protein